MLTSLKQHSKYNTLLQGELTGLASVVCHLSAEEPGNLLFAHLLQNGVFHKMCSNKKIPRAKLKTHLVLIFAHLFTRMRLPLSWDPTDANTHPSVNESQVDFVQLSFFLENGTCFYRRVAVNTRSRDRKMQFF